MLTYYNIGKILIEAQNGSKKAQYGEYIIKNYAEKLSKEFGKGYNLTNLKRMRQFYLAFPKGAPLGHQLNWSIIRQVLPMKNANKRNYYLNSVIEYNLSKRGLQELIKSNAYERLIEKEDIKFIGVNNKNDNNKDIINMIKNPIIIGIKNSVDKITEKALKEYMLESLEKSMRELGVGFAFVGSEIPIKLGNKIFRPDLIFFNIKLNCYVIIELKLNELNIRDISQLEFYVSYYDTDIKENFHNPTIGITVSKKVDRNIINYNEKKNLKHITYITK